MVKIEFDFKKSLFTPVLMERLQKIVTFGSSNLEINVLQLPGAVGVHQVFVTFFPTFTPRQSIPRPMIKKNLCHRGLII